MKTINIGLIGFGNVGSVTAAEISRAGAAVIAVADISGAVLNPDGLDIKKLAEHVTETGSVKDFPGAKNVTGEEFFGLECDILVPVAAGSQITKKNVKNIKAKIIAEGANAPTTPEADDILNERKIFVIPDILCNAGGVFVSYLEYTQETQREQMTLRQVEDRLSTRMEQRFEEVYDYAADKNVSMRTAAMDIAVKRVVEAVYTKGLLP